MPTTKVINAGLPIGSTIRKVRLLYEQSLRDAGALLGISYVHLCKMERAQSEPSPTTVSRLREVWGVDVYVLAWLRFEYAAERSLTSPETVALAKKLLCRGLGRDLTRAQTVAFLEGE